jgi:hypothetical protein
MQEGDARDEKPAADGKSTDSKAAEAKQEQPDAKAADGAAAAATAATAAAADASKAENAEGDTKAAEPAAAAAAEGDKAATAAAEGKTEAKTDVKAEVKEEVKAEPEVLPSDPATWPQPEAGEVVDGVKWMAKVSRGGEGLRFSLASAVSSMPAGSGAVTDLAATDTGLVNRPSPLLDFQPLPCLTCFATAAFLPMTEQLPAGRAAVWPDLSPGAGSGGGPSTRRRSPPVLCAQVCVPEGCCPPC